jgi:uncharacterized lipoprotein YehR (DUF1307 family)
MKNIRLMQRLLIIMGLVIIILGLGTCYGVMKERAARSEISDLQGELIDTKQRFVERIKNDSTKEYSQKQLIADKDIAIKLLGEEAKRYRNIKSVTKTVMVYDTDTIFAEYTDTVYKPIGREFCANEKYDTICGRVDSLGVVIYPHTTYLGDVTTTIANEKYGFLKLKSKPVVNVSFSNPNVRVVNMQNVVVKQPKPKRLAWLLSGLVVGTVGGIFLIAN